MSFFVLIPKDKNGKIRRGKLVYTTRRLELRNRHWIPLRDAMRVYCEHDTKRQVELAKYLGVDRTTIHRYICSSCEHDQEPSFSVGLAIAGYLRYHKFF